MVYPCIYRLSTSSGFQMSGRHEKGKAEPETEQEVAGIMMEPWPESQRALRMDPDPLQCRALGWSLLFPDKVQ